MSTAPQDLSSEIKYVSAELERLEQRLKSEPPPDPAALTESRHLFDKDRPCSHRIFVACFWKAKGLGWGAQGVQDPHPSVVSRSRSRNWLSQTHSLMNRKRQMTSWNQLGQFFAGTRTKALRGDGVAREHRLGPSGLGSHSATGKTWTDNEDAGNSAKAQAFKRACSCFGLGRYLYQQWTSIRHAGFPCFEVYAIEFPDCQNSI
jgi:hypothetical protein